MQTRVKQAVAAGALVFTGYLAGLVWSAANQPPLPDPVVEVQTKIVEREVVREVEVPATLPEACLKMVATLEAYQGELSEVSEHAGLLATYMDQAQSKLAAKDGPGLVEVVDKVNVSINEMNLALVAKAEQYALWTSQLEHCQIELSQQ